MGAVGVVPLCQRPSPACLACTEGVPGVCFVVDELLDRSIDGMVSWIQVRVELIILVDAD
jgi:hypothetical protein